MTCNGSRQTRDIVGPDVEVFVDANGGYTRRPGGAAGRRASTSSTSAGSRSRSASDDLAGLAAVRGAEPRRRRRRRVRLRPRLLPRICSTPSAVDCVQVDVTRCGGITELLRIAGLAGEHGLDVSGHCAPYQHAPALAAVPNLRHLEWFHDHVRIETLLFDGALVPERGGLVPSDDRSGHGLVWRPEAAEEFRVLP